MLSVATAITVPTASQKRRYSPKVAVSRQRTSTTGSRNCSAWSNALTAPSENARRARPCAAMAFVAAFIRPRCYPGQNQGQTAFSAARVSHQLLKQARVAREHFCTRMIALEIGQAVRRSLGPERGVAQQCFNLGSTLRGIRKD